MDQTPVIGPNTSDIEPCLTELPLSVKFRDVRAHTECLAFNLTAEDQCVQSMPDASPVKWHRAHTTWFFEEFVLLPHDAGYRVFDPAFRFLFNSYYEAVGPRYPRPSRGLITRPSAAEVGAYRAHVDAAMRKLLRDSSPAEMIALVELGLNHEQQHQELIVTDLLHAFAQNPLAPATLPDWQEELGTSAPTRMIGFPGGLVSVGHDDTGFAYDNETPRHQVMLGPYRLADRLVRNADWLAFIEDGGYRTPTLWMSDGWATVQQQGWEAPLYWRWQDNDWCQMGPGGLAPLLPEAPVRHVSWYEADAFARWAGARLPTEAEWEAASDDPRISERTGHVWQWTASPYAPYPGYAPAPGAIGEYNGKFMVNQMTLRGGSVATPEGHTRPTYRNFFYPDRRWQFSGLRLARTD
ncbi:MAG: ergothioneine biosynthesis protein EgtB [Acetobacteraceae bacterium]|nr:ergothioneine biosynthesis protein EgtB [Acetobacteraceae bacterium]